MAYFKKCGECNKLFEIPSLTFEKQDQVWRQWWEQIFLCPPCREEAVARGAVAGAADLKGEEAALEG